MGRNTTTREKRERIQKIRKNIKTIRCWMQMEKCEFATFTGTGRRGWEFETRVVPTEEEIKKIAEVVGFKPHQITDHIVYSLLKSVE